MHVAAPLWQHDHAKFTRDKHQWRWRGTRKIETMGPRVLLQMQEQGEHVVCGARVAAAVREFGRECRSSFNAALASKRLHLFAHREVDGCRGTVETHDRGAW